ncbi:hypothetical protein Peur_022807 [Populus x canadensis]
MMSRPSCNLDSALEVLGIGWANLCHVDNLTSSAILLSGPIYAMLTILLAPPPSSLNTIFGMLLLQM